jgi:hypothetical protein
MAGCTPSDRGPRAAAPINPGRGPCRRDLLRDGSAYRRHQGFTPCPTLSCVSRRSGPCGRSRSVPGRTSSRSSGSASISTSRGASAESHRRLGTSSRHRATRPGRRSERRPWPSALDDSRRGAGVSQRRAGQRALCAAAGRARTGTSWSRTADGSRAAKARSPQFVVSRARYPGARCSRCRSQVRARTHWTRPAVIQ